MNTEIFCDECGKEIKPGNTNGMPNGILFKLSGGKTINLCQDCLIEIGRHLNSNKKEGDAN